MIQEQCFTKEWIDGKRDDLRVMDPEAITKCMQYNMPILVFNMETPGNIVRALRGERVGTLVRGGA